MPTEPVYRPSSSPVIAVTVVSVILSTIGIVLRIWIRRFRGEKRLWWDDYVLMLAMAVVVAFGIINIYKLNATVTSLITEDAKTFHSYGFLIAAQVLYFIAAALIKLSILLLLYRTFASIRRIITVGCAVVTAQCIACIFVAIFQCAHNFSLVNPKASVSVEEEGAQCIDRLTFHHAAAVLNLFFYLMVLVIPVRSLWRMQMSEMRVKVGVVVAYISAVVVLATSVARLGSLEGEDGDPTDDEKVVVWSYLEVNLGVLAVCLPCFASLLWVFSNRRPGDGQEEGDEQGREFDMSVDLRKRLDLEDGKKSAGQKVETEELEEISLYFEKSYEANIENTMMFQMSSTRLSCVKEVEEPEDEEDSKCTHLRV